MVSSAARRVVSCSATSATSSFVVTSALAVSNASDSAACVCVCVCFVCQCTTFSRRQSINIKLPPGVFGRSKVTKEAQKRRKNVQSWGHLRVQIVVGLNSIAGKQTAKGNCDTLAGATTLAAPYIPRGYCFHVVPCMRS